MSDPESETLRWYAIQVQDRPGELLARVAPGPTHPDCWAPDREGRLVDLVRPLVDVPLRVLPRRVQGEFVCCPRDP